MAQTSARTPTTHRGRRRLRLVRSKSVGGRVIDQFFPAAYLPVFFCVRYQQIARPVGIAMTHPSAQLSSTHYWQRLMRLVWSKSVGEKNSCYHNNHHVNGVFFMQSPSDCTVTIRMLLETSDALGLVKIRQGTNSCYYYKHCVNRGFFMKWVISEYYIHTIYN